MSPIRLPPVPSAGAAGQKATEAETRELAERLTCALESLTDGFFTIDREWRFTYVNGAAERMFTLSRAELLGQHIWTKFPEARGTVSQVQYERALRDNVVVQFETFYPPLGIWFDARAFPSPQGLAVYFRDITDVRKAGEGLRTSEERFRLLSNATNDAIWDWDLATNAVWWNEGFEKLFGYRREDVDPTVEVVDRLHPPGRSGPCDGGHPSCHRARGRGLGRRVSLPAPGRRLRLRAGPRSRDPRRRGRGRADDRRHDGPDRAQGDGECLAREQREVPPPGGQHHRRLLDPFAGHAHAALRQPGLRTDLGPLGDDPVRQSAAVGRLHAPGGPRACGPALRRAHERRGQPGRRVPHRAARRRDPLDSRPGIPGP